MRICSLYPRKKGRVEIIPLIDVMFFLLASFMLASLSMISLRSMQMALPTATAATRSKPNVVNLLVAPGGDLYVDGTNYDAVDLRRLLLARYRADTNVQVYIKGDPASTYGMFIDALDLVEQVGIPHVSCAIGPPPRLKQVG